MSTQAPFTLRGRNPDVLTSIANLSNDEVFTPPEFANRMLDTLEEAWAESNDGANIWADSSVTFLDPFTKSGVFLREITKRLVDGLVGEIPNLQDRVNHVLTKQVFGIGITELTSLLARRSVYCSKWANGEHSICTAFDNEQGNIWFERTEHTWVGGTEKVITMDENGEAVLKPTNGKCKFCGANQKEYDRDDVLESHAYALIHTNDIKTRIAELFGEDMKFDVIIGNPPYQLSTGGGTQTKQARPIYPEFIEQAKKLEPRMLCFVVPSRWFSGGFGLDDFRRRMANDDRIQVLRDYPDAREVFGAQGPAGGVNYFLWNQAYSGPCRFEEAQSNHEISVAFRHLNEFESVIRSNKAIEVIHRIRSGEEGSFESRVSAVSPFGLSTSFRGSSSPAGVKDPITVRTAAGQQFMARASVVKNLDLVDEWKVLLSATASEHAGQPDKNGLRRIFSRIEILEPPAAMTHSYLMVGPFSSRLECENAAAYLRTKFVRFLVSVKQNTQHISRATFAYVPDRDFSRAWTDQELYDEYELTATEIELIEKSIREIEPEA